MRRRELFAFACGAAAVAPPLRAQQKTMPVIGYLGTASPAPAGLAAFGQGLTENGYVEGQNVGVEYRWVEGRYDRVPAFAAELVGRRVDVIVASGGPPSALATKSLTSTIPIVFVVGVDPVELGLVVSLARPGGNLTGISLQAVGLVPKRFELLSELVPRASKIALLMNPKNPSAEPQMHTMQEKGRATGVELPMLKASTDDEIETAFTALAQLQAGALIVGTDPFFNNQRERLVMLASRYAIPAAYEWREFAELGGLLSYGPSIVFLNYNPDYARSRKFPLPNGATRILPSA